MLPPATAIYTKASFQPYYTDSQQIRELMLALLGNVDGLGILEPCAGQGAFIEGLQGTPRFVDAVDIDQRHIGILRRFPKFVRPIHADFIDCFVSEQPSSGPALKAHYDAVICNPPYGLSFSLDYRKRIKRRLPQAYARESYGLFLYFAIQSLRAGGRYVFVVPDTFLTSRNHRPLRKFILEQGRPTHFVRFASRLFGSVNFGYGHLCVIAGNRGRSTSRDTIVWAEAVDGEATLAPAMKRAEALRGSYLARHCASGWVRPAHHDALSFERATTDLGSLAECRTGIYTGNNVRFCGYDSRQRPLRANGHPIDWVASVRTSPLRAREKQAGMTSRKTYVPFIRGGHRKPFEATRWALEWSRSAVESYRTDKKARLQNHTFYFREGLAIPMVTSGRLSASHMSGAVFDQGVVGVFPREPALLPYLLIYLNSEQISDRVKAVINPGANNSANYIKRIPVITPTPDELVRARRIVEQARIEGWEATATHRRDFISSLDISLPLTSAGKPASPKDARKGPPRKRATSRARN